MAKEKRRNSEKRKEKSRDAARYRRSKETEIFSELARCLPLPETIALQLDKASIMRLAISLLKIGDVLDAVGIADLKPGCNDSSSSSNSNNSQRNSNSQAKTAAAKKTKGKTNGAAAPCGEDTSELLAAESQASQLYLKAMEGLVFILSQDADFVYLTENVAKYLGLQQIEVMGQSIYDYIHPCDHDEIKDALNTKSKSSQDLHGEEDATLCGEIGSFTIRMKCTLTSKGRSVNLKSAPYKVMKCCSRLVTSSQEERPNGPADNSGFKPYLLVMMEPIPHPSNIEVPLDSSTFSSKHEMDMRFIFCDDRIEELAGYNHKAMAGQSFFDFQHALDSESIKRTFKDLFFKGQAVTQAYRMLAANGGYFWLLTQATTINNSRNQKPQSVVCVHYVLSGVEDPGVILSNIQKELSLQTSDTAASTPSTPGTPPPPPSDVPPALEPLVPGGLPPQLDLLPPKLELSTESIFAPKTQDCRPPDMALYKSCDPDEQAYLSPTAGEESVSLPFTAYKTNFLTSPLMPIVKSPLGDAMKQEPDMLSPGQCYGQILTPASSPKPPSTDCSRISSPDYLNSMTPLEMDNLDRIFATISNGNPCDNSQPQGKVEEIGEDDLADIDFNMRAPYIPMNEDEDLNLLPPTSTTLFTLCKDDINPSVFGRTESVFGPKQTLFEEPKPAPKMSVRDMLGESTVVASIEQPPETMYLQMKRPLDMNCLEKGPPAPKLARLEESVAVSSAPTQPCQAEGGEAKAVAGSKNSVLLNLLLSGEDNNYGYKVNPKLLLVNSNSQLASASNRFETLTSQDCEVNAPTQCCKLLQGQDLLKALDR